MSSGKLAWTIVAATLAFAAGAHAQVPGSAGKRRAVISADETVGAPPGFHAERRPRYGAIIGGAATAGLGTLMLVTGIAQHAEASHTSSPQTPGSDGVFFMIYGGASVAVGLPLLAYGLLSHRKVYVRDSVARVSLGFSAGHQRLGAGLTLAF